MIGAAATLLDIHASYMSIVSTEMDRVAKTTNTARHHDPSRSRRMDRIAEQDGFTGCVEREHRWEKFT